MTTYKQGETVTLTFTFYQKGSTTVLEDQDSVKLYVLRKSDNVVFYETESLTNSSTGTYTIDYTMPLNKESLSNSIEYEYRAYGLKDGFQTVYKAAFTVS